MLTDAELEQLCDRGWQIATMPPGLAELVRSAFEQWRSFFADDGKFLVGGDSRIPRGYLPLCERGGCEMKESFYIQPGYPLPPRLSQVSKSLICELGRIADMLAPRLERAAGCALVRSPKLGCLRMMRYPALDGEPESALMQMLSSAGAMRSPPHRDESALTLLPAASKPGLEVSVGDGEWQSCENDPRSLTLLLGKDAERRAPGRVRAALHRVANPTQESAESRMASAYFTA